MRFPWIRPNSTPRPENRMFCWPLRLPDAFTDAGPHAPAPQPARAAPGLTLVPVVEDHADRAGRAVDPEVRQAEAALPRPLVEAERLHPTLGRCVGLAVPPAAPADQQPLVETGCHEVPGDRVEPAVGEGRPHDDQPAEPARRSAGARVRLEQGRHSQLRIVRDAGEAGRDPRPFDIPVWFIPTRVGTLRVACSQLCGLGHFRMRGFITIQTAADFHNWFADQQKELTAAP